MNLRISLFVYSLLFVHLLYGQQQIQLHTDRTYYFPGDTVWYKAYMAHRGIPDTALRNLSVLIGRPDRAIIEQQIRPVAKGASFGQYVIPEDYTDRELYFSLRTKRDENSPFVAKVGVYQQNRVVSDSRPAVRIFADGGGLLPDMPNRISLQWNLREEIPARLCDGDGNEILSFSSDPTGRASLQFSTKKMPTTLHWSYRGETYTQPLPACPEPARLRMEQAGDSALIVIENASPFRDLTLLFSPQPGTTWQKHLHFDRTNVLVFPVEELLGGPYAGDFSLTYRDAVLATMRTDHYRAVQPKLQVENLSFGPFTANRFILRLPDDHTWNLSVAVHDGLLPDGGESGTLTARTAGAFRYTYPKNPGDTSFTEDYYTLSGRISMPQKEWESFLETRQKREQQLLKKGAALQGVSFGYRLLSEADFRYETITHDSLGNLDLRDITFYDTLQTRIVQIDDRLRTIDYDMEWRFSDFTPVGELDIPDFVAGKPLTHFYTGKFSPEYYTFPSGNRAIKEVTITGRKVDPHFRKLQQKFSEGWFSENESILDIELINEDIPSYVFTLGELVAYLAKKYPIIQNLNLVRLYNNVHDYGSTSETTISQLLPREMTRKTIGQMKRPEDITEIVFVRVYEKYKYNRNGGGAIMFYTSGVDARNKDIGVTKIKLSKVAGYSGFFDFHHKDYAHGELPEYDDRQTLYWNPDVQLSGGTPFPISFYNNTLSESFTVTVQGLSSSGRTLRFSKTFTKADLKP